MQLSKIFQHNSCHFKMFYLEFIMALFIGFFCHKFLLQYPIKSYLYYLLYHLIVSQYLKLQYDLFHFLKVARIWDRSF